jgi:hypothetical protein
MESNGDVIFSLERPLAVEVGITPFSTAGKTFSTSKGLKIDGQCTKKEEQKTMVVLST